MYTKMNFLWTKLRKMSTKGKKSKWLFQKWWSLFRWLLQRVVKFAFSTYWNNYFNSGRYFNSGCDVKLSLKLFSTTIEIIISIVVVISIVVATPHSVSNPRRLQISGYDKNPFNFQNLVEEIVLYVNGESMLVRHMKIDVGTIRITSPLSSIYLKRLRNGIKMLGWKSREVSLPKGMLYTLSAWLPATSVKSS